MGRAVTDELTFDASKVDNHRITGSTDARNFRSGGSERLAVGDVTRGARKSAANVLLVRWMEIAVAEIHRDHPFHRSPDFVTALRGLIDQPRFRSILGPAGPLEES